MLKIAILSEKYAHDYTWYVDTILNLIRLAGDYVSEEVWYRIVQVVINTQEVQGYAAKTCFEVTFLTRCIETFSRRRYIVYCVCTYIISTSFNQDTLFHDLCIISPVKRLRRYLLLNTPWRRNLLHQRFSQFINSAFILYLIFFSAYFCHDS